MRDSRWDWAGWHGIGWDGTGWDGVHIHGLAWVLRLGSYEMHCWQGIKRWLHLWLWHYSLPFLLPWAWACSLRLALDGWGGLPWLLHFGLLSICASAWSSAESSLHLGPTSVVFSVYRIHVSLASYRRITVESAHGYRRILGLPSAGSSSLCYGPHWPELHPPAAAWAQARGSTRDSAVLAFTFHLCVDPVEATESSLHPICLQMPV